MGARVRGRVGGASRGPRAGIGGLALALLALSACDRAPTNPQQQPTRSLEQIRADGTLVALTRNAPTTFYFDRLGEPAGPEHELLRAFAEHLGVELRIRTRRSIAALLAALEAGEGDLAAAGLTRTPQRAKRFRFGPSYQAVTQQVVCRRSGSTPESVAELTGLDLHVIDDSSYVERLRELRSAGHTGLEWTARAGISTEQLLREVWRGQIDCTVADSTIVDINRRYYPELTAPFNLTREQPLAWALPVHRADTQAALETWLDGYRDYDRLAQWAERHYGFFRVFDYADTRALRRRSGQRLPRFMDLFRAAGREHGWPPLLLAAQAYQESHWDPQARSPTGVRGLMMLTRATARELGVTDRLDPRQSVFGGARYLARMRARLDPAVTGADRTFLALAAYNIGRGHLLDAQHLARERGMNPHHWRDLKEVFPLLAQPRIAAELEYGYARGTEPVRYVRRIREYHHILERHLE